MAMVQDMADYIVDLVYDDLKTLLQVSLVSRVWVSRTRPYLFKSLKITDSKLRYLDPYCLPPLCKYVKTLYFTWTTTIEPRHILRWFERSEPHTLVVHSLQLHDIDEQTVRQSFAKFPSTSITTLDLRDISPTKKTLLTFLSLFPNTNNLTISINEWKKDQPNSKGTKKRGGRQKFGPPSISTTRSSNVFPLRASGSFKCFDPPSRVPWGCDRGKLLLTIATLPLQFHTVSLDIKEQSWAEIGAFLDSCSKTVRKLFLVLPSRGPQEDDRPNHYDFANLEGLRICSPTNNPSPQHLPVFLRSVKSPCLRRVIVEMSEWDVTSGETQWDRLDWNLVYLAERHKGYGNIVLQISTTANPEKVRRLLPRARGAGVLEVRFSERPDYCTNSYEDFASVSLPIYQGYRGQ